MTAAECAHVRELAPELALGIAEGDERAAALQHLVGCATCRREVADLAAAADATLLLAPSAEPPVGFESRALAQFADRPDRPDAAMRADAAVRVDRVGRSRRRWPAALAAAAVVVVAGVAIAAAQRDDRPGGARTVASAGWSDRSGALRAPGGAVVGRVSLAAGRRSTLTVEFADGAPAGTYAVHCDYDTGAPYRAGTLHAGPGATDPWTTTIGVSTYDLRRVRLVNTAGGPNLEAELPT